MASANTCAGVQMTLCRISRTPLVRMNSLELGAILCSHSISNKRGKTGSTFRSSLVQLPRSINLFLNDPLAIEYQFPREPGSER